MKKYLVSFAFAVLFFAGCKSESGVDDLRKEIEALKSTEIASVNSQITGIKSSISDLQKVDAELKGYIKTLQDALTALDSEIDEKYASLQKDIEDLEKADAALSKRIDELKDYCDQQNSSTREWVATTFTTLEQHSEVLEEIAAIKLQLGELGNSITTLDSSLSKKISDSEDKVMAAIGTTENSVKSWVNEQLSGYYTIAAADAKLKLLEDAYKAGDTSLAGDIKTLQESLTTAKSDLTAAYQKAIADAITENNGTINKKIADDIKAAADNLQAQINAINTRIDALESRVAALEASVAELIGMVQSIVVVPDYSDGSVKMTSSSDNIIRFEVYPLSAAKALAEEGPSVFSLDYVETETKASMFKNIPITSVSFDGEVISIVADGSGVSENITDGLASANARLRISSGSVVRSSEYFNLTYKIYGSETIGVEHISAISAILKGKANMDPATASTVIYGFQFFKKTESEAPTVTTMIASDIDQACEYSLTITGLQPAATYSYWSFVRQNGLDKYGETKEFTTKEVASVLETMEATDIKATSAILNAKLDLTDIQYKNLVYGFLWGDSETAMNTDFKCTEIKDNAIAATLTSLSHKTQYWYKAYVKLDSQTFYGVVKTFTTDVVPVKSVSLDKTEYTFHTIGYTLKLNATVLPSDATDKRVEWSSDKEDIATVDQTGKVTAKGNGKATVTATTKDQGKTASCEITVAQWVTGITLDKSSINLNEGESYTLIPTVNPDNAVEKKLAWTSSDESIATVDQTGKVTAVSKGTATIKATATDGSGKYASCSVTVKRLVSSIQLNKTSLTLYRGGSNVTEKLTATVNPSTANNTAVTWTSSNTTVATVSISGVVTGKSRGTATITVTANDGSGVNATCDVEVKQYVTSITLSKTSLSLVIGNEETISVTSVLPDNANDKTYTWSSSDPAIAIVDNSGKVTAKSSGSATIKATANDGGGVFASCSLFAFGEKVDMGIKTTDGKTLYWSTRNLCKDGFVSSPEQYGDYYAWGETETKSYYSWYNYKFGTGPFSKYNTNSYEDTFDNKTVLETGPNGDDVASKVLGGSWRMPTSAEWTELRNNCTWTWVENYNGSGINGRLVKSKTNDNSIFLPAAGICSSTLNGVGFLGYYWSSSLTTNPGAAWYMYFLSSASVYMDDGHERIYGLSVRPVSE